MAETIVGALQGATVDARCHTPSGPRHRWGERMTKGRILLAIAALCVAAVVPVTGPPRQQTAGAAPPGPCGTLSLSATHYQHVIWIWMENHSYPSIIGSNSAPYENQLATQCGLAGNYHNISHPSLPNYVGATSGLPLSDLQQFLPDCDPSITCDTSSASIFGQVSSWKAYEESMPANCDGTDKGLYAVRHNPPPYYTALSGCLSFDVPFSRLAHDLASSSLPAFSFITPNLNHDMHDGTVAMGDNWLKKHLKAILKSAAYTTGSVVLFITWDEGEPGTSGEDCATNTTDGSCHVAMLVVSPSTTPGTVSSTLFNHYSLLRTTEQLLGEPALGNAATANSMLGAFNL
jgi:phosphatidylinositol-3-phosphatase